MGREQKINRRFQDRQKKQQTPQSAEEFISPLDFLDMEKEDESSLLTLVDQTSESVAAKHHQGLFVVGTDVSVGKTVAICALGTLLKQKQIDVGVMKPIDCGSDDIQVFKEAFDIGAVSAEGSVYAFQEKITPYFAFRKNHVDFDMPKVVAACRKAIADHEVTLIEGPGGLFDPLTDQYLTADLVKELGVRVIVVAPLRRGTMNHLILMARQARACGVEIQGVLLTERERSKPKAYFLAKMQAVRELAKIAVLGIIPFLEKGSPEEVLEKCHKKVSFKILLNASVKSIAPPVDCEKKRQMAAVVPGQGKARGRKSSSCRGRRRRRVVKAAG